MKIDPQTLNKASLQDLRDEIRNHLSKALDFYDLQNIRAVMDSAEELRHNADKTKDVLLLDLVTVSYFLESKLEEDR